jgi:hypothetical protein
MKKIATKIFLACPSTSIFRVNFLHKFTSQKLAVCHEFLTAIFASKISNGACSTMAQTKWKTFLIKRKGREE